MEQTQQKVKDAVLKHHDLNTITDEEKKRITGINANGNMIHAPELRPSVPYAHPLYKLFTLDVAALYPSIRPELALTALQDALNNDTTCNLELKNAINEFTDLIFSESFVTYQGEGYVNKEGIPTGNCISRQVADVTMHWVLFKQIKSKMKNWSLINLWKRFIDDIFGVWTGTVRQFAAFVELLNNLAEPFGIR
ncbi:hypothetical protein ACHWQZ_G001019 [Mnemiopsis leidyi]